MRPSRGFLVRRPPRHRDFQIWEDVTIKLRTQTDVAKERKLSQPRIAQIVKNVAGWMHVSGICLNSPLPVSSEFYAWTCYASKLEAYERRAREVFEESCAPQTTVKVVAAGENAAPTRVETTTRPGKPHARLLADARATAYDLCLAQVELAQKESENHKLFLAKVPFYGLDHLVHTVTMLCRAIDHWATVPQTESADKLRPPKWPVQAIVNYARRAWRENPKIDFIAALPPQYAEVYWALMPAPSAGEAAAAAAPAAAPPTATPPAPPAANAWAADAPAPDWGEGSPCPEVVNASAASVSTTGNECGNNSDEKLLIVPEEKGVTSAATRKNIPPETWPRVAIRRKTPPRPRPDAIRLIEKPGAAYPLGWSPPWY